MDIYLSVCQQGARLPRKVLKSSSCLSWLSVRAEQKAEGRYCALNLISMGNIDEVMAQPEGELHSPRIAAGVDVSTSGPYLTGQSHVTP